MNHYSLKTLHQRALQEQKRRQQLHHSFDWQAQARPNQLPPSGDWRIWLILAGRGFGKTRTGAETIRSWVEAGIAKNICLLGASFHEARHVMVEGTSGLLSVFPPGQKPLYRITQRQLIWPTSQIATLHSAQAYEKLRGPQFDAAWVDELAKFPHAEEAWDQMMLGLRLGPHPRVIITTTPRPIPLLKNLLKRSDVVVTRGSTLDNASNLSTNYIEHLTQQYQHTRLGLQEIQGQMVDLSQNSLWTPEMIHHIQDHPEFQRVLVAVDPAVTAHNESDETGMIIIGLGADQKAYICDDWSGRWGPLEWGRKAIEAYHHYEADCLVAEVNNGGDLVKHLIHSLDPTIAYKAVRASRGKQTRAEPVAALYAQGRVCHLKPLPQLEAQLLSYQPDSSHSPDRLDALVWGLSELMLQRPPSPSLLPNAWHL